MKGLVAKMDSVEINKLFCEQFCQKKEKTNHGMEGNICKPYLTQHCYPRFTEDSNSVAGELMNKASV